MTGGGHEPTGGAGGQEGEEKGKWWGIRGVSFLEQCLTADIYINFKSKWMTAIGFFALVFRFVWKIKTPITYDNVSNCANLKSIQSHSPYSSYLPFSLFQDETFTMREKKGYLLKQTVYVWHSNRKITETVTRWNEKISGFFAAPL